MFSTPPSMAAFRLDADAEGLPRRIANAIRGATYRWLQNEEIVAIIDNAGAYPGLEVSEVAPVMPPGVVNWQT